MANDFQKKKKKKSNLFKCFIVIITLFITMTCSGNKYITCTFTCTPLKTNIFFLVTALCQL